MNTKLRVVSCPDCGYVYGEEGDWARAVVVNKKHKPVSITCPRCKSHYMLYEFWALHRDKYSESAVIYDGA